MCSQARSAPLEATPRSSHSGHERADAQSPHSSSMPLCDLGGMALNQRCFQKPESARCVQRFDDSLNPAIRTTYRISLRSSSLREPRHSLLGVVLCVCVWCQSGGGGDAARARPKRWARARSRPRARALGARARRAEISRTAAPSSGAARRCNACAVCGAHCTRTANTHAPPAPAAKLAQRGAPVWTGAAARAGARWPRRTPSAHARTGRRRAEPRARRDENGGQGGCVDCSVMILPQVHLRKPCYDFSFL